MLTMISILAGMAAAQDFSQPDFTHDEGLPWCDMIQYSGAHEDCALTLEDGRVLQFLFAPNATENEYGDRVTALEVSLFSRASRQVQTIQVEVGQTFAYPEIADIDDDGDEELMIPTYTGNVNTTWQVWQQSGEEFARAGDVNGIGLEFDAQTGLSAISARGSASSYSIETYQLTDQGLVSVYTLTSDLYTLNCAVFEGPAFAAAGVDAATLEADCEAEMGADE